MAIMNIIASDLVSGDTNAYNKALIKMGPINNGNFYEIDKTNFPELVYEPPKNVYLSKPNNIKVNSNVNYIVHSNKNNIPYQGNIPQKVTIQNYTVK